MAIDRVRRNLRLLRDEVFLRKEKQKLCLGIVDALDEPKHLLSDAIVFYELGHRERAIALLRLAPDKAHKILKEWERSGAPKVVTEDDIAWLKSSFAKLITLMEKGIEPEELEDIVHSIDAEIYDRMFKAFHRCMMKPYRW